MKKIFSAVSIIICCCTLFGVSIKKDNFKSGSSCGWRDQPYWSGKARLRSVDGAPHLVLTAEEKNNRTWVRAFASASTKELYLPDTKLRITVKAKGEGNFSAGILCYIHGSGMPETIIPDPVVLGKEYKTYTFDFKLNKFYRNVNPAMHIEGKGKAVIESFELEKLHDGNTAIQAISNWQIIAENTPIQPIEFITNLTNKFIYITSFSKRPNIKICKTDANGRVKYTADKFDCGFYRIFASVNGNDDYTYIDVQKKDVFEKTRKSAENIKLDRPINVLFLGDSLSDFDRGFNYIDRVAWWINKYNPGKFKFHNAGVGGDFLERANIRLMKEVGKGSRSAYRQSMYNGLFSQKYDYVFIFMGQNDTRCMPSTKYEIPETTPEEQHKYLTSMVNIIKEKNPEAKIVLISPSPSNEALFNSHLAKGRKVAFYGKTKFVNAYDEGNRKFCKDNNLDYIDILTPMRNYKALKDLYVTDGIHLSITGGTLIADEILNYFDKEF